MTGGVSGVELESLSFRQVDVHRLVQLVAILMSVIHPNYSNLTDAVGFTNITPHSVKLHWQQPRDCVVMGYELQQRFADADRWQTLSNTIVPEPQVYLVSKLEPATEYQFRLRALEPSGWRSWHNAAYSRIIQTLGP